MYEQREIVLLPFPYTDLTTAKKRPALIISNKNFNNKGDIICLLITTNDRKEDVQIKKDSFEEGGLPFKSFVRPYRIFTINKKLVLRKLCRVNKKFYKKVFNELNNYIN